MHPAYSVILFTTASGAGYGLLALLGLVGLNHGPASSLAFGLTSTLIALGLVTSGLLASTVHLGHPERAWRALSQWRSSWLSREGVAAIVTFVPALVFAAVWSGLVPLPSLIAPFGTLTTILCTLTVYCTGKIYSTLSTIRAWAQPLTVPVYLAFALSTGASLLSAIAAIFGRFQVFLAVFTAATLVFTAILKLLYWRTIDRAPEDRTIEAATGLGRIGAVSQWELPHTSINFVQKEMGYAIARKHAQKLRRLVVILLAIAIAAVLIAIEVPPLAVVTAVAGLAATLVERWLFFAEAKHVSMLFYGMKAA
jgi:DMSO reductase anchor subunit